MNKREKILATFVLALAALWAGNKLYARYQRSVDDRLTQVQEAKKRLVDVNQTLAQGRIAVRQMSAWQQRSLPSNREKALSLYKAWLLDRAKHAGLAVDDINPTSRPTHSHGFTAIGYQIKASGSLAAVTAMLYEFYNAVQLQQITQLQLTRPVGAPELQVVMDVEALSLPRAAATDNLPAGKSQRLKLASVEKYQKSLGGRDLVTAYTPPPGEATAESSHSDDSEHAHFTAALESGSGWQAWINVRTTGETLHVGAGDAVKVGTFEGQVVSVEPRSLVLKTGDKKVRVALGQTLRSGKEVDAETPAAKDVTAKRPET